MEKVPVIQEFRYEIPWPAPGSRPGHHRSHNSGSGFEFHAHAPLTAYPDPRRVDLYASLRDPFGNWIVRVFRQRSAIPVYLLADVSASMGFTGIRRKLNVLADFAAAAAYSAYRTGDAFGLISCDSTLREDLSLPLTRSKGVGLRVGKWLRGFDPRGDSAAGLLQAASMLGHSRSLVFLASDFHWPTDLLEALLDALSPHHVVPVVIWDRAEFETPLRVGIGTLTDSETGRRSTVFLRPALQMRLAQAFRDRQRVLQETFLRHSLRPLMLLDGFDADQVTRYFVDPHATSAST